MGGTNSKPTFAQRKEELQQEARKRVLAEEEQKATSHAHSSTTTTTTTTKADLYQDWVNQSRTEEDKISLSLGKEALTELAVYKRVYERLITNETDLAALLEPMLFVSALIYTLGFIRREIRNNQKLRNPSYVCKFLNRCISFLFWKTPPHTHTKQAHDFRNIELIMNTPNEESGYKEQIAANGLSKFMQVNDDYFGTITVPEFTSPVNVQAILGISELKGAYVYNFDDNDSHDSSESSSSDMVYGICVNEPQQRITVVFRGTVPVVFGPFSTQDLLTDANISAASVPIPDCLLGEKEVRGRTNMNIHAGFHAYLEGKYCKKEKEQEIRGIMETVESLLRKWPEFDLFVTGHR